MELALFNGEPDAFFFADSEEPEMCAARGGRWGNGASYGVFALYFNNSRSSAYDSVGGRPAYFKKENG